MQAAPGAAFVVFGVRHECAVVVLRRQRLQDSRFPGLSRSPGGRSRRGAPVRRLPRPTYANVASTLALFLSLGGVSWAAATLPRNSVGSAQIRSGAITPAKLSKATKQSLAARAGEQGEAGQDGDAGPAGERGPQGERGPAGP